MLKHHFAGGNAQLGQFRCSLNLLVIICAADKETTLKLATSREIFEAAACKPPAFIVIGREDNIYFPEPLDQNATLCWVQSVGIQNNHAPNYFVTRMKPPWHLNSEVMALVLRCNKSAKARKNSVLRIRQDVMCQVSHVRSPSVSKQSHDGRRMQ